MTKSLFDDEPGYEYGIVFEGVYDAPHRFGMTEEEARAWVAEWIEDGAKPSAVAVIRRAVGKWERV